MLKKIHINDISFSGNLSSLLARSIFHKRKDGGRGFPVFVSSLCLSDLLMGVYLAIIGTADQVLHGSYLWNELAWRRHSMCQVRLTILRLFPFTEYINVIGLSLDGRLSGHTMNN